MKLNFNNVVEIPRDWSSGAVEERSPIIERQLQSGTPTPAHIKELRSRLKFYTVKEVKDLLGHGASIWTIYDWINSKKLQCQPLGKIKKISSYALADFLERQLQENG